MTPAELNLYVRAYTDRRKEEQQITQANIYSLAALIRPMIWSKRPPSFETAFPGARDLAPKQEEQDDEQMYAIVRGINALLGGEEVS